ncbi:MAG TPA: ATP-binding protein [Bauldia sp.]|nr:ATP-binding protein [Bauldia sp.]
MAVLGEWIAREVSAVTLRSAAISSSIFVESYLQPAVQHLVGRYLPKEAKADLDRLLEQTPLDDRLISVKIWLRDGMIVYATHKELEGRTFPVDEVAKAAKGEVVARYDELGEEESAPEQSAGLPLIEVYAPLYRTGTDEVLAVGEYYEHAPWLAEQLRRAQTGTWLVVGVTTAAMLGLLFIVVRRGGRTIAEQRQQLQDRVSEARSLARLNDELRVMAEKARLDANESNEQLISRVGADLHDGPIQLLSMLMLKLSDPHAPAQDAKDQTSTSRDDRAGLIQITSDVLGELRSISTGLSLPEIDRMSLDEALQLAASRHEDITGAKVRLTVAPLPVDIPPALKACTYRVVQEALTNTFKHAESFDPEVSVRVEGDLLIVTVTDDGEGFDSGSSLEGDARQRLGLAGIRNRVSAFRGSMEIISPPGGGTRLIVRLPIDTPHALS